MLHQNYLEEIFFSYQSCTKKRFQVIYNQPNAAGPSQALSSLSLTPKAHQKKPPTRNAAV
jgi:hypothetical protein